MAGAMFHVKHPLRGVWRGSGRGLGEAGATLAAAGGGLAALLLAACSAPAGIAANTGVAPSADAPAGSAAQAPTPPAPPAPAPGTVAFTDKANAGEAVREFAYAWPAEVAAIPALAARFTAERDRLLAAQKTEWQAAVKEFAGQDCTACMNRSIEKTWEVVANLPRYLSLSAQIYEYTGGAHGNHGHAALVWDRETGTALDPKAMFASPQALQDALGEPWCRALAAERRKRLGEAYREDGYFPCPPIADLALLPGSAKGRAFDRIGLLAAPYVAGSYAEGTYEVTLPVTPAVLAAVRPEHRAAFALGK